MLQPGSSVATLVDQVSERLHTDQRISAGQLVGSWLASTTGTAVEVLDDAKAVEVLTLLLHWLLSNNGYEEAAKLLWGPSLFTPEPESCRRVWKAYEESNFILLQGAASMSKSYSSLVRLLLEYIRDPEHTSVMILGPSEDYIESNVFTDMIRLHRLSSIPLPGEIGKLFIGVNTRERKGAIKGVVVPIGKKAAGRLQGIKRSNRKVPHPQFGKLTRLYVFLEEVENIPIGIWNDLDNVLASSQGDDGLKVVGAYNPRDVNSNVGQRAEPKLGWASFDPDKDFDWVSARGWRVVRLDAARSENVVAGRVIYPGLQTKEGFDRQIQNAGGTESSPGYWTMLRGCFPPTGISMSVIPPGLLTNIKAEVIWVDRPTPCGGVDAAYMGGDVAVFAKGSFGVASGFRFPPSLEHPGGRTEMFKNLKTGRVIPRNVLLLEALLKLPKGETIEITQEIIRLARSFSIRPDWLCIDRTGAGQGSFDILRHTFGEVIGLNYSEGASETRIMAEDHAPASELYERAQSELFFALRKFVEFNYFKIGMAVPTDELFPELTGRRYRAGRRAKVEPKNEFQARSQGHSPDAADAVTLLVHCVRKATGFIPSMTGDGSADLRYDEDGDSFEDDKPRVDITNRCEEL